MTVSRVVRLFVVEWLTSARPSGDWRWLDVEDEYAPVTNRSVGWLIEQENRDVVVLAPNVSRPDAGRERQAIGVVVIPVPAIVGQWELRDPAGEPRAARADLAGTIHP